MQPIRYQVVGEEDYAFEVSIGSNGEYEVSRGTYTTEPPRKGTLTEAQKASLSAAIEAIGVPKEYPVPQGGNAFDVHLSLGEGDEAVTYSFWEGALEADTRLKAMADLLEEL
jgi:hypothetical protein